MQLVDHIVNLAAEPTSFGRLPSSEGELDGGRHRFLEANLEEAEASL